MVPHPRFSGLPRPGGRRFLSPATATILTQASGRRDSDRYPAATPQTIFTSLRKMRRRKLSATALPKRFDLTRRHHLDRWSAIFFAR